MTTVYTKTATKGRNGKIYAFGRREELNGKSVDLGGYALFVVKASYCGQARGGLDKRWVWVVKDVSYDEAVSLMNTKCGYKAFN